MEDTMTKKTKTKSAENSTTQNAAVRLGKIEQQLLGLIQMVSAQQQSIQILADEIDKARELTLGVARRLNATISSAEQGALSHDSVNRFIVDQNVKSLESMVEKMVEEKVLTKKDSEIEAANFVVGSEVDLEGNVVNPRIQFLVNDLLSSPNSHDLGQKLLGKKASDSISFNDKMNFVISEVYSVQDLKELDLELDTKEA